MIYLEELVDAILAEEGQTLMGLDFVTKTLGLSMKKIETIFVKSAKEYEKRKPLKVTEIITSSVYKLPDNAMGVRCTRYGILPELPRFYQNTFGEISYEYDPATKIVKVWPPVSPIKVTYNKGYNITTAKKVTGSIFTAPEEDYVIETLPATFKRNTILIEKNNLTMVEVDRGISTIEVDGEEVEEEVVNLEGDLGSGTVNLTTRELDIDINDTSEGYLKYSYYPLYKCIEELDIGNYVFTKLFASKLLESLASLRAQATQKQLHNIDLTEDELYARARYLKREVNTLLKRTLDYGALSNV